MDAGCLDVACPRKQEESTSLSEHLKAAVNEFYVRDDISRQVPGKRDSMVVRQDNVKKTMHK